MADINKHATQEWVENNTVPLTGTKEDKPLTGTLEFDRNTNIVMQTVDYDNANDQALFYFSDMGINLNLRNDKLKHSASLDLIQLHSSISSSLDGDDVSLTLKPKEGFSFWKYGSSNTQTVKATFDYTDVEPENKLVLAQRVYVDSSRQFVKNGEGWSLKYKVDNPSKYEPTGENAIDFTKAYADSTVNFGASGKNSFAVGAYNLAKGNNSTSIGYNTKAYGSGSHVYGYMSTVYSGFATIFGGSNNEIGTESEITTPVPSLNTRATIVGGQNNKIINGNRGTIVGGSNNTITAGSSYNPTTRPFFYNSIFGGYGNEMNDVITSTIVGGQSNKIIGHSTENVTDIFVTGNSNVGRGSFSSVFGYSNTSITQGEFIVGLFATSQNSTLLPNTYYPDSRMFNVGIGNDTNSRKDGLSVFKNGLVTAPELTSVLIDSNPSSLVTKEYLDIRIPKPPTTGNHVLKAVNGVVSWVAE